MSGATRAPVEGRARHSRGDTGTGTRRVTREETILFPRRVVCVDYYRTRRNYSPPHGVILRFRGGGSRDFAASLATSFVSPVVIGRGPGSEEEGEDGEAAEESLRLIWCDVRAKRSANSPWGS